MSTSPSWFDQEKFSRLVKKVGPKTPPPAEPAPVAAQPSPDTTAPASEENLASTARISLVSKPPSLLSEHRALPALPRRTAPLPGLKSLFSGNPAPTPEAPAAEPSPAPIRAEDLIKKEETKVEEPKVEVESKVEETQPEKEKEEKEEEKTPELKKHDPISLLSVEGQDDNITAIWHKMALLNEELAQVSRERDQANSDAELLREQLRLSDENLAGSSNEATKEEFARLISERDAALAEAQELKAKAQAVPPAPVIVSPPAGLSFGKPPEDLTKTKELTALQTERDQARKQYSDLRKEYETLKQANPASATGQIPNKEDSAKFRKELEQQLDGFRQKLEEKNKEIAALKAGGATPGADAAAAEITSLKEQLTKIKEEASVAQRGLALSQKALHETRDTLREATEGSSLSRHNFDNLKNECAQLSQQNSVLQAQNDQLTRELAAAKSKLTTRV